MKGLIVKDIELTKNQGKMLLILAVVIGVFLEISGIGSDFATAYITIIFSRFASTTVYYDEYENGFPFLLSLPVSRRDYVNAKYAFSGILILTAWIIGTVFGLVFRGIRGEEVFAPDKLGATIGYLVVSVVFVAVMLPLRLKFEGDKGKLILPLVIAGAGIILYGGVKLADLSGIDAEKEALRILNGMGTAGILGMLAAIMVLAAGISWLCSRQIMMKKEF